MSGPRAHEARQKNMAGLRAYASFAASRRSAGNVGLDECFRKI